MWLCLRLSADLNSKEANIYEISSKGLGSQIFMFLFFSFYFQRKSRFSWRGQHFKKILIVKEELDGIDIDDIGNVEDLLRIAFIHEECGNLKVFVDGWELIRNINKIKKPGALQACRCPICDKFYRREYFFNKNMEYCESVSMISWESVVNNLKGKKLPAQINHFDLILARRYWNCSNMENLWCLL